MPLRPRKPWTVLIYMVADDPQGGELLDSQAVTEMDHIIKATLSVKEDKDLYVGLQVDFRSLPGVWRRLIGGGTFVRPESNAADPATLYGFFEWAANECPAEHYLLIFWGHSRGQFGMFGDSNQFEYTAQTLTLDELGDALRAARRALEKRVDIIAFKDCFMANLETAYELSGLADYLLASSGLVPVVGWPYDKMFKILVDGAEEPFEKAKQLLDALKKHYDEEFKKKKENDRKAKQQGKLENVDPQDEVPYSLLSTAGAALVVKSLAGLIGTDRSTAVPRNEKVLRENMDEAAAKAGDPALVDLGTLVLGPTSGDVERALVGEAAADQQDKLSEFFKKFADALGNAKPKGEAYDESRDRGQDRAALVAVDPKRQLVINHTGKKFGGVSVFVYPRTPKGQRDSMLTRLAGETAYKRLALSTDTNWADIALQFMPRDAARQGPDVSTAIAILEQLQRVGIGLSAADSVTAGVYARWLAGQARSGALTDAALAQAAEYNTVAELAARLALFAADKGGAKFGDKGGAKFGDKGGAKFGDKGGAKFGPLE